MLNLQIKSTRLDLFERNKIITILGLLDKLNMKVVVEKIIDESNFDNNYEYKKKIKGIDC